MTSTPPRTVFLNGTFVSRADARVSAFDAGLQHAIGLFETLLARRGVVFRPRAHAERLVTSARALGLIDTLRPEALVDALQATLQESGMESARLRLTITGGDLNVLQSQGRSVHDPTVLIVAQPPTPYPETFFEKGVTVALADGRVNPLDPLAGHKTLAYWARIRALQLAGQAGASEAIWFSVSNHLASGSVSNIFLVRDGALLTPYARGEEVDGALPAPVLPGITRSAILEIAGERSISVERRMLTIDDLLGANEVFLTNSSWGVLPVTAVEKHTVGAGEVGPITHQVRREWLALIDRET